jgi:predicted nucleic acid-binding protein
MIKVVCNSSPIIGLSIINKLELLWELFDEVFIPKAVYDEILNSKNNKTFGVEGLINAVDRKCIKVYEVKNKVLVDELYGKLHRGELETIISAKELKINDVIIDEKAARSFAEAMLLQTTGVIGILILAKKTNRIPEIKKYLDLLISQGYRISNRLYENALKKCCEMI